MSQAPQSKEQKAYPSEYDRQQAEIAERYYVVRQGLMWHVKCGDGTRSLLAFISKRDAERAAAELLTAFKDGQFSIESTLKGGGRYA